MFSNQSISRLLFYFLIGIFAAAIFFFKGYTSSLKIAQASEATQTQVLECVNGSKIFVVKDGILIGKDGDLISSGFELIPQTSIHSDLSLKSIEDLSHHHLIRHPKPLFPRWVKGTVASIASGASDCYFHWMFDVLSKMDTLEKSGLAYDRLYVSETKHPFQKETLELLGIAEKKLLTGGYWTQIYAETILAVELPTQKLKVPAFAVEFLKDKILPHQGPTTAPYLFVSRKKAPSRRVLNEDEAVQSLAQWNVSPIFMEDYKVSEQAWIASQAQVIIAAHGSGLVNLIFAPKESHVIELLPEDNHPPFYKDLCKQIGITYHSLECKVDEKENLIIPIDKLTALCSEVLCNERLNGVNEQHLPQ